MSCGRLDADDFADAEGGVCLEHVDDAALGGRLRDLVTERTCIVCDRTASETEPVFAVRFSDLLGEIAAALHRHYVDAEVEGVPWDSEEGWYMGASTYRTYEALHDICDGAFTDGVSGELEEKVADEFPDDIIWTDARGPDSLDALDWAWESFAETVQSQSRFVIVAGGDLADRSRVPTGPASFLARLAAYADGELDLIDDLEPGSVFYRGRLMDDPMALEHTCMALQPPPPEMAAANRMSPAGISMFYAASDTHTAIAEIAGHGPQPYALVGAFRSTMRLRLLDFTRTPTVPSYFDEAKHPELGLAQFLKSFVYSITQPVIPDGRQHIEYTPTQVLTEYLRWMPEKRIDGIALPSAQTGEKTYVLFFNSKAFADADRDPPTRPASSFAGFPAPPERPPVFTLAKEDIRIYQVRRHYEGVPYP